MHDVQRSKFNMIQGVSGVFTDNKTTVTTYPMLQTTAANLDLKINAIHKADVILTLDPTANTAEKRSKKEQLAVIASELAAAGAAYAADKNDIVLENTLKISYSDIHYGSDVEASAQADVIWDALNGIDPTALTEYFIEAADMEELKTAIQDFDAISAHRSSSKSERVATTLKLKQLFREADVLLEKTDRIMKRIQRKEPGFFNTYTNARQING